MKKQILQALSARLRAMPLADGETKTAVSCLSVYRCTGAVFTLPDAAEPYLLYVVGGGIRLHTPSGILDYVAGQISASAIDTPFCGEVISRTERGDCLAVCLRYAPEDVISVVLSVEGDLAGRILGGRQQESLAARAEERFALRLNDLLSLLGEADLLAFLQNHLRQELLFYMLLSSGGKQFLQSVIRAGQAGGEIYEVNTWIKRNFRENFSVEDLARRSHMSVSAFHQKFKNAVGMGPLQCQKRLRLTEARRLMLNENAAVTDAAVDVGYESVSQFIRDYKKMFGSSPKDDVLSLRRRLEGGG